MASCTTVVLTMAAVSDVSMATESGNGVSSLQVQRVTANDKSTVINLLSCQTAANKEVVSASIVAS